MKKFIMFLILFLGFNFLTTSNVHAEEMTFYEGEYVPGIWMVKENKSTHSYQTARFFRRQIDGKAAFCLQPFKYFNADTSYSKITNTNSFSNEQIDRINKIAYYGYEYDYRTNPQFYAITQMMIWKITNQTDNFYFTNGLNGPAIYPYEDEIAKINYLVDHHNDTPSFNNNEYNLVVGENITITDTNNILNNFTTNSDIVTINGNNLTIKALQEGTYNIELIKSGKSNKSEATFYYENPNSQNMMTSGYINDVVAHLTITVKNTKVTITKIDSDNLSTTPSGEASLIGAKYTLFDKDMNKIKTIEIAEDNQVSIDNLNFGKYYLKEIEAGVGYKLDEEIHEINISKDTPTIEINLENEVIKKKIEINKRYGNEAITENESNIAFNIYDNKDNLIKTIITDNNGYAYIILPYGKYTIKQLTSTEGYHKVKDFTCLINEESNDTITFDLIDYVIKVPNTHTSNNHYKYLIISFIILSGIVYVQKKYYI